jgi:hypothetical protein
VMIRDREREPVKVLLSLSLVLKSCKCLWNLTVCRRRDENLFCVHSISYYLLLVIGLIGSLENLSFHEKMCANISFMLVLSMVCQQDTAILYILISP